MRDPARIARIMNLIHHIWLQHPDMRFHQLLDNLKVMQTRSVNYDTTTKDDWFDDWFYFEDNSWEDFLIHFKGFE